MKLSNVLVHPYFDQIKIVARPIFLTHIYMYAIGPHSMHRVGEESRCWVTQWMKFHRLPKSAQCKLFKLHPVITCNSILQELVKHKSHTGSSIKLSSRMDDHLKIASCTPCEVRKLFFQNISIYSVLKAFQIFNIASVISIN